MASGDKSVVLSYTFILLVLIWLCLKQYLQELHVLDVKDIKQYSLSSFPSFFPAEDSIVVRMFGCSLSKNLSSIGLHISKYFAVPQARCFQSKILAAVKHVGF